MPLLQGIAAALDHLHARGLAHLDVRPENVIVTPDGEVKLIDFGVAQAAGVDAGACGRRRARQRRLPGSGTGLRRASQRRDRRLCPGVRGLRAPHRAAAIWLDGGTSRQERRYPRSPRAVSCSAFDCPWWRRPAGMGGRRRAGRARARSPAAVRQRRIVRGRFSRPASRGISTSKPDGRDGRVEPPPSRQFPNNEPGVAVKGSPDPRVPARQITTGCGRCADEVVDAAFAPLSPSAPASPHMPAGPVAGTSLWSGGGCGRRSFSPRC